MTFLLSVLCTPWLCPWHRQSMGCVYGHATINNCQHTSQAPPYQEGYSLSRPWKEDAAHHSPGVWVSCGCHNKNRVHHSLSVWVSCGCYNKHTARVVGQFNFMFFKSVETRRLRLKFQAVWVLVKAIFLFFTAHRHCFLTMGLYGLALAHAHRKRVASILVSFYWHTSSTHQDPMLINPPNLITSLLQMRPHWGLGLQHMNLEKENTLRPQPQYPIHPFPLMIETGKKMNPVYRAWKWERRVCWQMLCHWPALWPCEEHTLPLLCGTAYEAGTIATLHEVPSADPDTQQALCTAYALTVLLTPMPISVV